MTAGAGGLVGNAIINSGVTIKALSCDDKKRKKKRNNIEDKKRFEQYNEKETNYT